MYEMCLYDDKYFSSMDPEMFTHLLHLFVQWKITDAFTVTQKDSFSGFGKDKINVQSAKSLSLEKKLFKQTKQKNDGQQNNYREF